MTVERLLRGRMDVENTESQEERCRYRRLISESKAQEFHASTHNMQACLPHTSDGLTAGEGCYSKTRRIAISRCATFRPRAASPGTAGECLAQEGEAANKPRDFENRRHGRSQFRAEHGLLVTSSAMGLSFHIAKAGGMSRF